MIPFTVGPAAIVGQGPLPEYVCRLSFDPLSTPVPTWVDASTRLRRYSVDRGRGSELDEFDGGRGSVTLDNRDRAIDAFANSAIRPMARVQLISYFAGATRCRLNGYADAFPIVYDRSGNVDAEVTIPVSDEFKVLALDNLPADEPPSSNYQDFILAEKPDDYWPMGDDSAGFSVQPAAGSEAMFVADGTLGKAFANFASYPIVGDNGSVRRFSSVLGNGTGTVDNGWLTTSVQDPNGTGDLQGASAFSVEFWFRKTVVESCNLVNGPDTAAGFNKYSVVLNGDGSLTVNARDNAGVLVSVSTGAGRIAADTWFYVVVTVEGGNLRLYLNGVLVAGPTAFAGFGTTLGASAMFRLGTSSVFSSGFLYFSHVAFYRRGLTAGRVAAHYTAGVDRGYPAQPSGARIGDVLDDSTARPTPRRIGAGVRTVQARYHGDGPSPLDKIREAEEAEAIDAAFFVAADGALVFLASDHRASAPYNAVQATFGDGIGELGYSDPELDYSDAFLFNYWTGLRDGDGAVTQTVFDQASIDRYRRRPDQLSGVALSTDADVLTVITAQLAKYKDPFPRVVSFKVFTDEPDTIVAALRLELMDRIRFLRRPPGGGSAIDQTLFVQSIKETCRPGEPPSFTFGVSPL